ncbi:unnamed protein product [Zymoseptoria tritici ST99CH_1E4]|uniref:Heterokaryon incompatibility domain-containing protein n=1 Tax=Zymoseptoria tritici ST99CH_1E4 TaxID=1276532 RepID=A0A2H1GSZ4_ZYMTR|nr:unnamed protein product [Zymoseptoria tritici ST99CH_1E4]
MSVASLHQVVANVSSFLPSFQDTVQSQTDPQLHCALLSYTKPPPESQLNNTRLSNARRLFPFILTSQWPADSTFVAGIFTLLIKMRLLNVSSFVFTEFHDHIPPYIAASHRWTTDECTYKDIRKWRNLQTTGYKKVKSFCEAVEQTSETTRATEMLKQQNCDWLWIDTACINKTSSAELSESLNSMFQWYANAQACYAFLHDVGSLVEYETAIHDFLKSEWFRRGWTLQELLAPRIVVFFTRSWEVLGHKCSLEVCDKRCDGVGPRLNTMIEKVTRIPAEVLRSYATHGCKYGVEARNAWAADRITTRPEDRAYCLLGLLQVHMVPIYGEGEGAWDRLEEAIEKKAASKKRKRAEHRPGKSVRVCESEVGPEARRLEQMDVQSTWSYPGYNRKGIKQSSKNRSKKTDPSDPAMATVPSAPGALRVMHDARPRKSYLPEEEYTETRLSHVLR